MKFILCAVAFAIVSSSFFALGEKLGTYRADQACTRNQH